MGAGTLPAWPEWMTLPEAAAYQRAAGISTLRRAIHATDAAEFPPPLRAKRGAKGVLIIRRVDLDAWVESLPDA
ncbi:helix-turn-helix domain-containing protein [Actinotalea sp. M2MS4P-6]|uniref:helix-turn-helix domain-containing protein n=1 Tax=Actinotalea sp. M2MS4P-6 TaxID=2983762 RepID=UPI0021E4709F|nr:helix-turn-helix domain-containing protein [Actinotalea sp. M2MS4P-6]MCV2395965.1 helix-turn-helix domain-containing protein [Actinotalea sp. M2MS4P-6]